MNPLQPRLSLKFLGETVGILGEEALDLGSPKQQAVLGALALQADKAVSTHQLVEAVWGIVHPANAVSNVHVYVRGLRNVFEPRRQPRAAGRYLLHRPSGYVMPHQFLDLDVEIFTRRLADARRLLESGSYGDAVLAYRNGLALWRGTPLAEVPGPFAETKRASLIELKNIAVEECIDSELNLGRHNELIPALSTLVREQPWRERLYSQLMLALYRAGRQREALTVFQEARHNLLDELGIEPGVDLSLLHERILRAHPALNLPASARIGAAAPAAPSRLPDTPRMLPPEVPDFTGRCAELDQIHRYVKAWENGESAPLVAISGMAGVGKTALAVHAANQIREAFPGGQIYLNLNGYGEGVPPTPPADALAVLLAKLGAQPQTLPQSLEKRMELFRELLGDHRLLLVLDNARSSEQVRPLIPARSNCFTIITSRNRLAGLVARNSAKLMVLDILDATESTHLLRQIVGSGRVDSDLAAATTLCRLCGGLPLALRIAGSRAATRPRSILASLADELKTETERLGKLIVVDDDEIPSLRAVFSWSHQSLKPLDARMFTLLGLLRGNHISPQVAAALAGVSRERATAILNSLVDQNLLEEVWPAGFRLHDLLQIYASELASALPGEEQRKPMARVLSYYAFSAAAANRILAPHRSAVTLPGRSDYTEVFASYDEALAWCSAELVNIEAVVRQAVDQGFDEIAARLPIVLWNFLFLQKPWSTWIEIHCKGLVSARRTGNKSIEAWLLHNLANAYRELGRLAEALDAFTRALEFRRQLSDSEGEAWSLTGAALTMTAQGDFSKSLAQFEQALQIFATLGDRYGEAVTRLYRTETLRMTGRLTEALDCGNLALAIFLELRDQQGVGAVLHALGEILHALGRSTEALTQLAGARAIRQQIGDRSGEGESCSTIAKVLHSLDRKAEAGRFLRAATKIFKELGDPRLDDVQRRLRNNDVENVVETE
ncbi:BTAD domain-containing putative transcriptional regulator [Nonomuraea sp. NPDC003709]|uniref:AfsR/SARP family transcriptional regulator n=1 Tax=Nonomuraea sp. NPDC003709 TaxID=3154450 RepID=UPI0033AA9EC7